MSNQLCSQCGRGLAATLDEAAASLGGPPRPQGRDRVGGGEIGRRINFCQATGAICLDEPGQARLPEPFGIIA